MTDLSNIHILIAEDNQVSLDMMTGVLKTKNYQITGVRDGEEAIQALKAADFDLALVDINMAPKGGFEFAKHLVLEKIELPVIIITGDESSDMLVKANDYGIKKVLQKPVLPERLLHTVERVLGRNIGGNKLPPRPTAADTPLDHEDLMLRAIELAVSNALSGEGRAFGAVIADEKGHIVGEGTNKFGSRADPLAIAEIMAIQKAAKTLDRSDLSDCILYSSCEPTLMAKALILSVGIKKVYYSLGHSDVQNLKAEEDEFKDQLLSQYPKNVEFEQICHEQGLKVFSISKD